MTPTEPVYPPGSVFTPTWWTQAFRVLLLGGLVFWIAVAFWPRGTTSSLDHLVADLRAGEVIALQIDDEQSFGGLFVGPWRDREGDRRVRWRTDPDGPWYTFLTREQPHHTLPSEHDEPVDEGTHSIVLHGGRDPVLNVIAAELERLPDYGSILRIPDSGWRVDSGGIMVSNVWLLVTWLAVLGTLIGGPQPRLATKWA